MLQRALAELAHPWPVVFDWRLPRINRRIDAIVLAPRSIIVCALRHGTRHTRRDRDAVEDAALDLHDFHAASRAHPVVPLLVTDAAKRSDPGRPLLLSGVTPVVETDAARLGETLRDLGRAPLSPALDPASWQAAPYRPIPSLIEAARMLYADHGGRRHRREPCERTDAARGMPGDRCSDPAGRAGPPPDHRLRHWHSWRGQDVMRPECRLCRPGGVPDRQSEPGACVARGAGAGCGGLRPAGAAAHGGGDPGAAGVPRSLRAGWRAAGAGDRRR